MTQDHFELSASPRVLVGKKTKKLRRQGVIPANIFGEVKNSLSISVLKKDFQSLSKNLSDTSVVYVQVEGEKEPRPTLIDSIDTESLTGEILHISFRQVNLKEAVTATVPVELIGELSVVGATAVLVREELEVEALPTDLPEAFSIDLANFTEIGQEVLVKDLNFDRSKVALELDPEEKILQIQEVEQMAEVEETPAEVAEVETTEQGTGEEKAEGEGEKAVEDTKEEEKK